MAKFLVIDLDKKSFIEDTRAIKKICDELKIIPYIGATCKLEFSKQLILYFNNFLS